MSQIKYSNLCLAFSAILWFCSVTCSGYSLGLNRPVRSVANPEVDLTAQPCPANRIASVMKTKPDAMNSAVAYLLITDSNPEFRSVWTNNLETELKVKMLKNGTDLCSNNTVLPNNTAPELRSDCPFIWTKNVKLNRFPEVLMEVKCLCGQPKTNATWESLQTGVHVACEEVTYTMPVLWRIHCNQNVHMLKLGFDRISIGCVRTVTSLESLGKRANTPNLSLPS